MKGLPPRVILPRTIGAASLISDEVCYTVNKNINWKIGGPGLFILVGIGVEDFVQY